ncbi:MAG: DUF1127 domain-containing protein [Xanthobacteraceae bacterium]|nr:DUF1127 domain-containing protein [Xanthobacteraceae bacterium]
MTASATAATDRAFGVAARIPQSLASVLAALLRAYKLHTCRRMLQELPDDILKDIGVPRSDIRAVARLIVDRQIDETRRSTRFAGQ